MSSDTPWSIVRETFRRFGRPGSSLSNSPASSPPTTDPAADSAADQPTAAEVRSTKQASVGAVPVSQRPLADLDPRPSPVADHEVESGTAASVVSPPAARGPVNTAVPPGVQVATAWSWRLLVIAAAAFVLGWVLRFMSEVVVPVVVGLLLCALLAPVAKGLRRLRLPAGPAAGITVLSLIVVVAGLLTAVGATLRNGFSEMADQLTAGIGKLREMLRTDFGVTDVELQQYWEQIKDWAVSGSGLGARAAAFGSSATHVFAGLAIALFCLFFFLYQGEMIWSWLVRLFPRSARAKIDSSGRRGWVSLTAFVRATILVAAVDAIGISIGAWVLGLPVVGAIGALVFVGAFVPIVGALVSGAVAVLIALVAQSPLIALIMLGVVILVQQIESHVLQPFLMGKAVSVHPLAVILAIAAGVVIAGIVGALLAVPVTAVANAVVKHLAGNEDPPGPRRPRRRQPAPA